MRKFITTLAVVATTLVTFTVPSMADHYGNGYGHHKKRHYQQYHDNYRPHCRIKKIRFWDDYGNLRVKRVKVCR